MNDLALSLICVLLAFACIGLFSLLVAAVVLIRTLRDAIARFGAFTFSVKNDKTLTLDLGHGPKVIDRGEMARKAMREAMLPKRSESPVEEDSPGVGVVYE